MSCPAKEDRSISGRVQTSLEVLIYGCDTSIHELLPFTFTCTFPKSLELKLNQCQNRSLGCSPAAGTVNSGLINRDSTLSV